LPSSAFCIASISAILSPVIGSSAVSGEASQTLKLRQGSCFPGCLEPRRTVEKALVAVIQEAWIGGVPAESTSWCRRWG
jgi:hypothetical protein